MKTVWDTKANVLKDLAILDKIIEYVHVNLETPLFISPEFYEEIKDKEEFKDTVFTKLGDNYLAERRTIVVKPEGP